MADKQLKGPDGKPKMLFENGKLVPVYSSSVEDYTDKFITLDDVISAIGGMFQTNPAVQPQTSPSPSTLPQSLLSQGIPELNPMASPMPAGMIPNPQPNAPTMGEMNAPAPAEGPWDRYLKTWQDPGFAMQYPFARGDQNTGAGNVAAGFGNAGVNLPQNMWHLYDQVIGKPFAGVAAPAAAGLFDFFTKPEGQVKAENAPAPNPTGGFQPGIPQIPGQGPGQGPGPNPTTTSKIIGVESGGKATAQNPNSSAYGPGQFIKSTWMDFLKEAHPELAADSKLGEKDLLSLRSDPAMAEEATAWYAGKAIDELDSLDLPATDANIYLHHFLGPAGMRSLLTADPNTAVKDLLTPEQINANKTILGGARSAGDVIDWATAKMGDAAIGPYVPGAPPPSRPQTVLPDFSQMNSWLDQAAPTAPTDQQMKDQLFYNTLAGFGSGVGSVNAEQVGGGAFWGAVGAGTSAGARDGVNAQLALQKDFETQQRQYAGTRANVAGDQAGIVTNAKNTDAQSGYLDQVDLYNWTEGNQAKAEERNLLISQEAKAQEAQAKLDSSPKILNSSAQGLVIQNPDGSVDMHSWDQNGQWDQIEQAGKALGMDSPQVRQMKYNQLATSGANLVSIEMEIIKDIVLDGMGPAVFGDAWGEALSAAEDQLPGGLAADPKLQMAEQQKAVMGLLLGASQQNGNYDWVLQAASLGNPGAIMLTQGGKLPNE